MTSLIAQTARVLVADPVAESRTSLIDALSAHGLSCLEARDGNRAWMSFRSSKPDIVVSVLQLPGLNGLDLLTRVREVSDVPFLIQIPAGEIPAAVQAVRAGAADVIPFPCETEALASRIRGAMANAAFGPPNGPRTALFVGRSNAAVQIRSRISALAGLRIPVLFRGESGAGRTHAARCLISADNGDPNGLVRVRPLESFSRSQVDSKKTFYLDAIDRFPKVDQAYWVEVIKASERSDPNAPRRVLASTMCDLDALSRAGQFDPGLAHCLLRFVISIPTLRERLEDFAPLVEHLSASIGARIGRQRATFSAPALRLLQMQPWPANVAQLASVVEKLVAFTADGVITKRSVISVLTDCPGSVESLRHVALERQRDALVAMLDTTGGNLAEAARRMKMSRGAIIYRAQKFGLLAKRIRTDRVSRGTRPAKPIDSSVSDL